MNESNNIEKIKQNRQKPPLSVVRIAGEILTGTTLGLVGLPVAYVTGTVFGGDCTGNWAGLAIFVLVFFIVHGLGSAVGVYLVGSRGNETGSLSVTLGLSFLGVLSMFVMFPRALSLRRTLIVGVEKIVLWTLLILLLLIPPFFATLGFNSSRRYKEPPSS